MVGLQAIAQKTDGGMVFGKHIVRGRVNETARSRQESAKSSVWSAPSLTKTINALVFSRYSIANARVCAVPSAALLQQKIHLKQRCSTTLSLYKPFGLCKEVRRSCPFLSVSFLSSYSTRCVGFFNSNTSLFSSEVSCFMSNGS